jgi:sirohydrochlorin ferrochelatase
MSGTRSPSPAAPATDPGRALLIVAHGECAGAGDNMLARELARRMKLAGAFNEVAIGYVRIAPSIEDAARGLASPSVLVYPLFMSDGYYVRQAIPERLGLRTGRDTWGHKVRIAPPLGVSPDLPVILDAALRSAAGAHGLDPGGAHVLLVAHGSTKSPHSADVARSIVQRVEAGRRFASVSLALLEEEPFLADALRDLPRPLLVLGLFAGEGLHGGDDLTEAVRALDDQQVFIVEQLGGYAGVIELIARSLA